MNDRAELLMLGGIAAICPDCAVERVLVPADSATYCCTTCDAAVVLTELVGSVASASRVA